jgi:hypothetical protein
MDTRALCQAALRELAALYPGRDLSQVEVHTDTSDFYRINAGDVVLVEDERFLVGNNTREGRFGLDDEVKHWVKRATDLPTGERRIIKLAFHERFDATIGGIRFECFRSPHKESRILELVRGNPSFMQGHTRRDTADNPVRILEVVAGRCLPDVVADLPGTHEEYFHATFPALLDTFIESARALAFLHEHGEKHGDVRRDHLYVTTETGRLCWIDFDYNFVHRENIYSLDVFGLGNILIYLAGKGDATLPDLRDRAPDIFATLYWEDLSLVWQNRVANLRKVYPYIPEELNKILLYFSNNASIYYERADQMIDDLMAARQTLG